MNIAKSAWQWLSKSVFVPVLLKPVGEPYSVHR